MNDERRKELKNIIQKINKIKLEAVKLKNELEPIIWDIEVEHMDEEHADKNIPEAIQTLIDAESDLYDVLEYFNKVEATIDISIGKLDDVCKLKHH